MKMRLDSFTGSLTMYRLVLLCLAAIAAMSLVLSAIGQLSYSPLALLASLVVSVALSLGASWLGAVIVRVKPHLESALITGLLVFFIMQPSVEPLSLGGIALAAVMAGASKYVLAVRGRHVFNPAALGAFIPTIIVFATLQAGGPFLGLSYAVWWVGTPLLQIAVVLGGFLVLYRTQRLTLGLIFVVLATAGASTVAIAGGQPPLDAVRQVLLQSPILFFAAFMLSEPLTLPPRRWQQLLEALVVAALFTIPLPIGALSNNPLFALLVGNLIGFAFGQRRGIRLDYLGKTLIGPSTWQLAFQPARPVRFRPGQFMELSIPHVRPDFRGSRRYFSISSAPSVDGPITFALTVPEKSSSFKRHLLDLEVGAVIRGTGVGGDFSLPQRTEQPLLLVAGGIGITPFASQLAHAHEAGDSRDVVVVYATSAPGPLPYAELLEKSGARVVLFAPAAPTPLPANWEYAGDGRITRDRLAATVPDAATRHAFISGPPALVANLRAAVRGLGVKRVHVDYFSGY